MASHKQNSTGNEELLERIVEHFTKSVRSGNSPDISQYQAKHPELRNEIKDLLSSVAMIEELKRQSDSKSGSLQNRLNEVINLKRIGDYRIVRELGRGGMGIVFEAVHESLGRRVALKVLPGRSFEDANSLERFRREAQAAASLHHTNIVSVFGVGQDQGHHYYVMEFVEGCSLNEVVQSLRSDRKPTKASLQHATQRGGVTLADGDHLQKTVGADVDKETKKSFDHIKLPTHRQRYRWVAAMCAQIADALAYAHDQGTLHRDLKPANLMLDNDGIVWLTDFGLVKNISNHTMTKTGDIIGTPQYMAPESFEGKYDERSETYCLGLTLFELTTLSPAYENASTPELIRSVTTTSPAAPRKIDPDVPRDLNTIIQKAVSKEPENRYQTASALRDDLRAFLQDRPIQARRFSPIEQVWRWRRRNPLLAALSLISILLLATTAATATVGYLVSRQQGEVLQQRLEDLDEAVWTAELNEEMMYEEKERAEENGRIAEQQRVRAEENIEITLDEFDEMFKELISKSSGKTNLDIDGLQEISGIQAVVTVEDAATLERLVEIYKNIAQQTANDQQAMSRTARAFRRVGNAYHIVGNLDDAMFAYDKSILDYKELLTDNADSNEIALALARTRTELATAIRGTGDFKIAHEEYVRAKNVLVFHPNSQDPEIQIEIARILNTMAYFGTLDSVTGEPPAPLPQRLDDLRSQLTGRKTFGELRRGYVKQAIEIMDHLIDIDPDNPEFMLLRGKSHRNLAEFQFFDDEHEAGARSLRRALGELEQLNENFPQRPEYQYVLALAYKTSFEKSPEKRQTSLLRSLQISEQLVREQPENFEFLQLELVVRIDLADTFLETGDSDRAKAELVRAAEIAMNILRDSVNRDETMLLFHHVQSIARLYRKLDPQLGEQFLRDIQDRRRFRPQGRSR